MLIPPIEEGTKWFDRFDKLTALRHSKGKLTILSKVEGPMGFTPWSRGPLLHRGEKRQLSPHRLSIGSNTGIQTPWSI